MAVRKAAHGRMHDHFIVGSHRRAERGARHEVGPGPRIKAVRPVASRLFISIPQHPFLHYDAMIPWRHSDRNTAAHRA